MAITNTQPTAAARRMRVYRKRRRNRMQCFSVLLHTSEIDGLIRKGYLADKARHDRRAVQQALDSYVCELLPPPKECSDA